MPTSKGSFFIIKGNVAILAVGAVIPNHLALGIGDGSFPRTAKKLQFGPRDFPVESEAVRLLAESVGGIRENEYEYEYEYECDRISATNMNKSKIDCPRIILAFGFVLIFTFFAKCTCLEFDRP